MTTDVDDVLQRRARAAVVALTDDQLEGLRADVWRQIEGYVERSGVTLDDRGACPEAAALFSLVAVPLAFEQQRRQGVEDEVRVLLDANGHEVSIGEETVRDGRLVWWAFCSCDVETLPRDPATPPHLEQDEPYEHATYEDAVATAARHAAEHGGRWMDGYPDASRSS